MGFKFDINCLKWVSLIVIYASLLTHVPVDYPVHIGNAYYFNHMINAGEFVLYNPYFSSGKLYQWNYGVIANLFSGLLYSILGKYTVRILEAVLYSFILIILEKNVKDKGLPYVFYLIGLFIIMPFTGAYPFLLSTAIFISGYFSKNKSVRDLTKLVAGVNHIFYAFFNFACFIRDRKLLTINSLITIALGINIYLTTSFGDVGFLTNFNMIIARGALCLLLAVITTKKSLFNKLRVRQLIYGLNVITVVYFLTINVGNLFIEPSSTYLYGREKYYDLPAINGITRLVSEYEWSGLYELELKGVVMETPLNYHELKKEFNSYEEYLNYLMIKEVNHVIIDRNAFNRTEHNYLKDNFKKLIETERYSLFEVNL